MSEQPNEKLNPARSLGIALGVTEYLYLLGLAFLTTGVSLAWSLPHGIIVCGVVILGTAFYNDQH